MLGIAGAGVALAVSSDLRKKVLDTLFGAEEEFEYTSTTTAVNAVRRDRRLDEATDPSRASPKRAKPGRRRTDLRRPVRKDRDVPPEDGEHARGEREQSAAIAPRIRCVRVV